MSAFYSIIYPTDDGSFSFLYDMSRAYIDTYPLNQVLKDFATAQKVVLQMKQHFPLVDYKIVKCEIADE